MRGILSLSNSSLSLVTLTTKKEAISTNLFKYIDTHSAPQIFFVLIIHRPFNFSCLKSPLLRRLELFSLFWKMLKFKSKYLSSKPKLASNNLLQNRVNQNMCNRKQLQPFKKKHLKKTKIRLAQHQLKSKIQNLHNNKNKLLKKQKLRQKILQKSFRKR